MYHVPFDGRNTATSVLSVAVVVRRNRNIAALSPVPHAETGGRLAQIPLAGRRPEDGLIGRTVAVEIAG